ncbi:hypothetical protein N2152v2_000496 [Parachlorella kessleri]
MSERATLQNERERAALLQAFCQPDQELQNAVAVPVTVRGRTAAELLVSLPAGLAQPGAKKLVALHYKRLLQYADADALLILAHKVLVRMLQRTPSQYVQPGMALNKALLRVQQAADAAAVAMAAPGGAGSQPAISAATAAASPERLTALELDSHHLAFLPTPSAALTGFASPVFMSSKQLPAAPLSEVFASAVQPACSKGSKTSTAGMELAGAGAATLEQLPSRHSLEPETAGAGLIPASPFHAAAAGWAAGEGEAVCTTALSRNGCSRAFSGWDFSIAATSRALSSSLPVLSPFAASISGSGAVASALDCLRVDGGHNDRQEAAGLERMGGSGSSSSKHPRFSSLACLSKMSDVMESAISSKRSSPNTPGNTKAARDKKAAAEAHFKACLEQLSQAVEHLEAGVGELHCAKGAQSLACATALCHLSTALKLQEALAVLCEGLQL